jgi:hypothetical protein
MKHLVSGVDMPLGHSRQYHSGANASHAKEKYKTSSFWLRQSFQNKLDLGEVIPLKHLGAPATSMGPHRYISSPSLAE